MCLSPSLFPLPPLSPTVLEPYLKAKRKTGFNTPARALRGASPAGTTHRPDGARSSAAPRGVPPTGATRVSAALQLRASPTHPAAFGGGRRPCLAGPLAAGGPKSLAPPPFAGGWGVRAAAGGGALRSRALAALEERPDYLPVGLSGFSLLTHPTRGAARLFSLKGIFTKRYRLGNRGLCPPSPSDLERGKKS